MNTILPDRPSELIRLALHDLEEIEQLPGFEVCMNSWLTNVRHVRCAVCLAGAVMVRSLFQVSDRNELPAAVSPSFFKSKDIEHKLYALNDFRSGYAAFGLEQLGIIDPRTYARDYHHIRFYSADPNGFKIDMHRLADHLERSGL